MQQRPVAPPPELDALANKLVRHAVSLSLKSNSSKSPTDEAERATMTLISTRQRDVFVTCSHVLQRLEQMRKEDPSAQMVAYIGLDGRLAELTGFKLIDSNERPLDIAIFQGMEDRITLAGLEFIDYASSYLPDPIPGDFISIVGYPGANITFTPKKGLFGYMHLGLPASSVSEKRIVLANEHGSREFVHYGDPGLRSIPLGGLSGSPAFAHRDGQLRFVGIVTDGSARDQTILISRLGCINTDGTINGNLVPC